MGDVLVIILALGAILFVMMKLADEVGQMLGSRRRHVRRRA